MKNCPRCNKQHEKNGVYCSRSCANSRVFSEEARQKKSKSAKKYWASLEKSVRREKTKNFSKYSPNHPSKHIQFLFNEKWENLGRQSKRLRVIIEQQGKCNKCGISEWQHEIITLEYEHKDGNNHNDSRNNVEALCPNCHSLTKTWRGRNNNGKSLRQRQIRTYLDMVL